MAEHYQLTVSGDKELRMSIKVPWRLSLKELADRIAVERNTEFAKFFNIALKDALDFQKVASTMALILPTKASAVAIAIESIQRGDTEWRAADLVYSEGWINLRDAILTRLKYLWGVQ